MARLLDADDLIAELEASCMPIHEKGISGIPGDNSSIADIINSLHSEKEKEPAPAATAQARRRYQKIPVQYYTLMIAHCLIFVKKE